MDEAQRSDLLLARDYARLVERVGHVGFLAGTPPDALAHLRQALARVGAIHEAMILDEAITIDGASRDAGGAPTRDYLEIEERALERLDRELFRQIPKLEERLRLPGEEAARSA